ncbi:hypothetical protein BZM27_23670 [Paraburkholderia steynii]|uniref:Uncharacterized protein n=1 Tax=Paraburkholderia steynii TaxID=1245441 RepID=A0A4R0X958_9BURK|nr:hypothetical protein BZM27_23670 [Paraburkholderia steynii]
MGCAGVAIASAGAYSTEGVDATVKGAACCSGDAMAVDGSNDVEVGATGVTFCAIACVSVATRSARACGCGSTGSDTAAATADSTSGAMSVRPCGSTAIALAVTLLAIALGSACAISGSA